mmetsp:Transcript_53357/g.116341  ORF Transcript_53357/g.116341 Transcript_53357/m.116341 type:complete len:122 (+) Transcript_53357:311-676(+)
MQVQGAVEAVRRVCTPLRMFLRLMQANTWKLPGGLNGTRPKAFCHSLFTRAPEFFRANCIADFTTATDDAYASQYHTCISNTSKAAINASVPTSICFDAAFRGLYLPEKSATTAKGDSSVT